MIHFLPKGRFEKFQKRGEGGFATIWKAREVETGREVAIKILNYEKMDDVVTIKRFKREAEFLQKLNSDYIVKYYDSAITDDICYIVMEYIDGKVLRDYIRQRGNLNADETVIYSKYLALALHEIHRVGVVHRDIKSTNVMINNNNWLKVFDFGISQDEDSETLTKERSLMGSVQYIAPELALKERATVKSDIYAMGILMYEMLAGKVPFSGKASEALVVIDMHKNIEIPRISKSFPNVPQALENVILKACHKDPEKRYDDMLEFHNDLDTVLSDERSSEGLISFEEVKKKTFTDIINHKYTMYIVGALFLLILAGLLIALVLI